MYIRTPLFTVDAQVETDTETREDSIEIFLSEQEEDSSERRSPEAQNKADDQESRKLQPPPQKQTEQRRDGGSAVAIPTNAISLNNQLRSLLNAGGGLKTVEALQAYFQLCDKANTWDRRSAMLAALQAASDEVLSAFISKDGMRRVLQGWLEEALTATNTQCVSNMLTTLSRLPATKESLSAPCKLPNMVNRITKNTEVDQQTASQARMIIVKWRKLFPKKKPSTGVPPSEARMSAAPVNTGGVRALADSGKIQGQKTNSAPSREASAAGKAQKRKSDSNNGLFEDVDVFAAQRKPSKQAEASGTSVPSTSSKPGPNTTKGTTRVRVVASNAALSQAAPRAQPKATQVARVSANPLDMLGMSRDDKSSTSQSAPQKRQRRIALVRASDPLPVAATAAERAKAAADRVPDEPPREKKPKPISKSKVAWADGWGPHTPPVHPEKLVEERVFLKNDPPIKAKNDAVFDGKSFEEANQSVQKAHKQFEMAARKQHHSEAQALKEFKAAEDQERRDVEQRLREMRPTSSWRDVPNIPRDILVGLGESLQPARGGQSTEVSNRIRVRNSLPPASHALESPEEPPPGSNVPIRPLHLIPKIPLSVEEAKAAPVIRQKPVEQQKPQRNVGPRRMLGLHGLHGTVGQTQPRHNSQASMTVPGVPQPSVRPSQGHLAQSSARPNGNAAICKFFNTPQGCQRGDECFYQHIPNQGLNSGIAHPKPTQPMRRQTSGPPRSGPGRPMKR